MSFPENQPVIDLMMGIPGEDNSSWYDFIKPLLMDAESRELFKMPAQYMFKDIPQTPEGTDDYIAYVVGQMDKYNIGKSLTGLGEVSIEAVKRFPDRFMLDLDVDPNRGMEEVRRIKRMHAEHGIKAVSGFPAGKCPQVPINDKRWYPIYAACVELDIPVNMCAGVPGPRVPMACQHVELIDEVVWFFPDLRFVMRHGAEPWADLAVKLMLKYPNLYYSTSAFSPKYYPKDIIDFANTRGSDQVMYAGYFPMGLSLEKIFSELKKLPLKEEVWPKFLYENARRVYAVDD
jgi:predicted TIM-barrel fold metal-dependent hydrolase